MTIRPPMRGAGRARARPKSILALMTYAVVGSMPIGIFREMRNRGIDVAVAFYHDAAGQYTSDPMADFRAEGRLLDLTAHSPLYYCSAVDQFISENDVGLVIQIGCEPLYQWLGRIKQRHPEVFIQDMLFNEIGHTVSHFLFENAIDEVIVESESMRAFVEKNSEKESPAICVLPNGVDVANYAPIWWTGEQTEFIVGYVGRMSPEKNPLGFIEIAERLSTDAPWLRFLMFGDGPMAELVREKCRSSPVSDKINFVGFEPNAARALQQLDLLIVPSVLDGRPNIIMEANACGLPVIASPVGSIAEMITQGENGFLLRPYETDMMSSIIHEWRINPPSYEMARRKARGFAEQHFSRERMVDDYETAFRNRLGSRH